MSTVLLVCLAPPADEVVEQVAGLRTEEPDTRVGLVALRRLPPAALGELAEAGLDPALVRSLTAHVDDHGPAVRRALRDAPRPRRLRLLLQHDPWLREQRAAGARLVPLDPPATRALARLDDEVLTPDTNPLRAAADAHGDRVAAALAAGDEPADLAAALHAELAYADARWAADDPGEAAWSLEEALRVAFHRVLHVDRALSPLAADPAGFLAPLRASAALRRLRGSGGFRGSGFARAPRPTGAEDPRSAPTRVLVLTRANADFLAEVLDHLGREPAYDLTFRDLAGLPAIDAVTARPGPLLGDLLDAGDGGVLEPAQDEIERLCADADVVLVEWWTGLATLVSHALPPRGTPGRPRVIVRAHSYELFTAWPHLTDLAGIDDLVFVSEHLRDLALAVRPDLAGPGAPRLHVLTLGMDLRRCVRRKPAEARFTLGVVGASKVVKDPRWAIAVLRLLREHDPRYRLVLVRGRLQHERSHATRAYADALAADLADLADAVTATGHTDDVPGVLEQVGVVVSSSVRESFHIGLVEGAASGAVPVVRDWPYFPGAAAGLFPVDWIVADPAAAAERILALTADEETWRAAGAAASAVVVESWDWQVVRAQWDALLLPRS